MAVHQALFESFVKTHAPRGPVWFWISTPRIHRYTASRKTGSSTPTTVIWD